jgi:hypothetical protein
MEVHEMQDVKAVIGKCRNDFEHKSLLKGIKTIFLIGLSVALLTSCGSCDSIDEAISVIDRGIEDITSESASWQTVLQRVAANLPKDISNTIRQDAQQLASRSIAEAGIEFRCNVDFLGDRAIRSLQQLKAQLRGTTLPPLAPAFCQMTPDAIDLKANPDGWGTITLSGYDMDKKDSAGSLLKFEMLSTDGTVTQIDENYIARTTHYQITINLRDIAKTLYEKRVVKLCTTWTDYPGLLPEAVVLPWQPNRTSERVDIGRTSYMPPKVRRGDKDFTTKSDKHMSVVCKAQSRLYENTIQTRVYMHAREERSDWTEVEGWSDWAAAYTPPDGWRIVSYRPNVESSHSANITTHGKITYSRPAGEIVSRYEVWGDREGDEAGIWTKVEVFWRPFEIEIEEILPNWIT